MKIAEVKNPSEEKPVEKPKFDNPRFSCAMIDFDWQMENGNRWGALEEILGCRGKEEEKLIAYAIERFEAAGAMEQADALRMKKGRPKGDAVQPSKEATPAEKFKEVLRRFSHP